MVANMCVWPQPDDHKALFLEELAAIQDTCQGPWAVVRDFNVILNEEDKSNARINRRNMARFKQVVEELELKDLHLNGRLFTWSIEREQPTLVKLDRVLTSLEWEELFPFCYLQALSTDIADHCPLLLQSNGNIKAKPRFHFKVFWPKLEGYLTTVERGWICDSDITNPFRRLDCLLCNVARKLQSWSAKRIGHIKTQLLLAREVVLMMDMAQEHKNLSEPLPWSVIPRTHHCEVKIHNPAA